MHPETLRQHELAIRRGYSIHEPAMRILSGCHHFHVSKTVLSVARAVAEHEVVAAHNANRRIVFPVSSRLPASSMVLTVTGDNGVTSVTLLERYGECVDVISVYEGDFATVGTFVPGSERYHIIKSARTVKLVDEAMLILAMILSLINEPRIVDAVPASGLKWSRQHRKAVERVTGKAAMAFSVVSWKIGKRAQAIGNRLSEDGHPKALHWCRAHWRRAEEGQPKAEWVNIPRKGGWGWYCWAADCWKGHPDFGIKLQRHEPHLDGEPRSRFVGGDQVLDATRFAAMGAAQRSALVEAGFAPSGTLH